MFYKTTKEQMTSIFTNAEILKFLERMHHLF